MAEPAVRIPAHWQAAAIRLLYDLPKPVRRLLAGRPVVREGQLLDPDTQLLIRLSGVEGGRLVKGTVLATRAAMEAGSPITSGRLVGLVDTRDLRIPAPDGSIPARLYTPSGAGTGTPLLVFYHGGGFVIGSLASHDNACRFLARHSGARVLSVDYRLAPEHPFPAAVDDAVTAFGYAVEQAESLGADPNAVAVGGDSAGGNLAAVVCHTAARSGGPKPVFALLFYPATDASTRRPSRDAFGEGFILTDADMDWFIDHYQPDPDLRVDPRLSVLLAKDLTGFPPTYVATAGFDPLRDEGEAFGARLAEAGVPVVRRRHPDLVHGFLSFLGAGERNREAVAEAVGALRTGFALATAGR